METFYALLDFYARNSPVIDEFFAQRPVTRSFDVFFDLRREQTNGWVYNRETGDLRHNLGHYDVIAMCHTFYSFNFFYSYISDLMIT